VVRGFGTATVVRHSNQQKHGLNVRPWASVTIENVFTVGWKQGPIVGTRMTVIPLGVDVAPISVEIVRAEYAANPCADELPWIWSIELAPVKSGAFFDAKPLRERRNDTLFDVAVVYPEDAMARVVDAHRIGHRNLPPNATPDTVRAAIDLHGDGTTDVVELSFCCDDPRKSTSTGCDHTCTRTYERVRGRWRLIDRGGPC